MLERFDLQGAVAIGHFDAHAAARRQRHHLVSREFALVENVEHFPPDIAGRSDHRDFVTHRSLSEEKCLPAACRRKGKRQRFYARNAVKTTLDRRAWAFDAIVLGHPSQPLIIRPRIHPALTSFADECCGTLARLIAYVGTLALLAIVGVHLWDQLPAGDATEPAAKAGWSVAARSHPAFAVSQFDLPEKTETYEIFRHPEGGRKDVLRWAGARAKSRSPNSKSIAPAANSANPEPAIAELAARMDPDGARELEAAGVIDSKFGTVTLLRLAGDAGRARPALASSNVSTSPICRSPAGRARATHCRPGAPRSAAC